MTNKVNKGDGGKKPLKKHVAAVHSSGNISLLQRKIANVLLYNAYPRLLAQESHEISISELSRLIGYNSNDVKTVKTALIKLISTVIEWNLLEDGGDASTWNASSIIADAQISGSICRYSYSPLMRQLLHNPSRYAVIDMHVQTYFKSSYALALYENCVRYADMPNEPQTPWLPLTSFRRLMGVPDGKYKNFNDFKKRVIVGAIHEVNSVSPIEVSIEYRKISSSDIQVKFFIKKRQVKAPGIQLSNLDSDPEQDGQEATTTPVHYMDEISDKFGITIDALERLVGKYGKEHVVKKADMILGSKNYIDGKIKNLAGYLTKSIEQNYTLPVQDSEASRVSANMIELRDQYDAYALAAIYDAYMLLDDKERKIIDKSFLECLGGLYQDSFRKRGFSDFLIKKEFLKFIRSTGHPLLSKIDNFSVFKEKQEKENA